ncbi:unnamed protein product [Symbiodinium sp. CCMP2592]|nr:unnamed protein product [Symbiodinium sp. CCMP2592]
MLALWQGGKGGAAPARLVAMGDMFCWKSFLHAGPDAKAVSGLVFKEAAREVSCPCRIHSRILLLGVQNIPLSNQFRGASHKTTSRRASPALRPSQRPALRPAKQSWVRPSPRGASTTSRWRRKKSPQIKVLTPLGKTTAIHQVTTRLTGTSRALGVFRSTAGGSVSLFVKG